MILTDEQVREATTEQKLEWMREFNSYYKEDRNGYKFQKFEGLYYYRDENVDFPANSCRINLEEAQGYNSLTPRMLMKHEEWIEEVKKGRFKDWSWDERTNCAVITL